MTVIDPDDGELFNFRVQSYHTSNPTQKWSNHYTARVIGAATTSDLETLAGVLASFHQALTYTAVVTERVVVSTWLPDGNPYDPLTFASYEFNLPGTEAGDGAAVLPLEVCLYIRKVVATGRTGKIFLRGALAEDEVQFGGALFTLTDAGAINTRVSAAETASGIAAHYASGSAPLRLCVVSQVGQNTFFRFYLDVSATGARMVNMNHRYYDRA